MRHLSVDDKLVVEHMHLKLRRKVLVINVEMIFETKRDDVITYRAVLTEQPLVTSTYLN